MSYDLPAAATGEVSGGMQRLIALSPIACAVTGLAAGAAAGLAGRPETASLLWALGVLPVLGVLFWQIVVSLRRGDVGLDLVAALSMVAALWIGEALAAAVVALM